MTRNPTWWVLLALVVGCGGGIASTDVVDDPGLVDLFDVPSSDEGVHDDGGNEDMTELEACIPNCEGKECGNNGCGGSCGECDPEESCLDDFKCHLNGCPPDCTNKECGSGGCGYGDEVCGTCDPGETCTEQGQCVELPCNGVHPETGKCEGNYVLYCSQEDGQDVLTKIDCSKEEGDQVCGWDPESGKFACLDKPTCKPFCMGKECGSDGCSGSCGECTGGQSCKNDRCVCKLEENGDGTVTDPCTGLVWQKAWGGMMKRQQAEPYCLNNEAGLPGMGWHLPNISELRSLIRGCPETETGGVCPVVDVCPACGVNQSCLSWSSCGDYLCAWNCYYLAGPSPEGCYWDDALEGDCTWYLSSSLDEDSVYFAFFVWFEGGDVERMISSSEVGVRCVR